MKMLRSALERWFRMPHPNFQLETESFSVTVLLSYWKRVKSNTGSRSWELTPNILTHFFVWFLSSKRRQGTKLKPIALFTLSWLNQPRNHLTNKFTTHQRHQVNRLARNHKSLRHPGSSIRCTRHVRMSCSSQTYQVFLLLPVHHRTNSLTTNRERVPAKRCLRNWRFK